MATKPKAPPTTWGEALLGAAQSVTKEQAERRSTQHPLGNAFQFFLDGNTASPVPDVEKRTFKPSSGSLPKWLADIADEAMEKIRNMPEEEHRLWDKILSLKEENRRLIAETERLGKQAMALTCDLAVNVPYAEAFKTAIQSLSERDNERLASLFRTSLKGRHPLKDAPLFFAAIAEDLVASAEARTKSRARDKANGKRGGNAKAEKARKKEAVKRDYLAEKNAPRRAALESFQATHPRCTLPEAAKALSEAIPGLSKVAAKTWLARFIKGGAIPQFAAGYRGRPRKETAGTRERMQ